MKKYIIQPNLSYNIYVGTGKGNRQILAGRAGRRRLLILFFDEHGNFLEIQEKSLDEGQSPQRTLINCLKEFDFQMEVISIQKFFMTQYTIGIQDNPYENREELNENEYQHYLDWEAREDFILYWGKEYYCDIAGKIFFS